MIQEWIRHSVESKPRSGVAVLVDGENISQELAGQIINRASSLGPLVIKRVYGNAAKMPKWEAAPGFRLAHSGSGKNATDLLLAIEAVSLFHEGSIDTVVIASSDRDFSHLAHHLRERQMTVVGMGAAHAPDTFRKACSQFIELAASETADIPNSTKPVIPASAKSPAPTKMTAVDQKIVQIVKSEGQSNSLGIAALGAFMHSKHKFQISSLVEKTWRKYLTARPSLYRCDPKGTNAKVHLVKP
jgi:uncharacterized LabA/DUF88 family protein